MSEPDLVPALVAELGKKTGVSWLTYASGYDQVRATHAAWHAWVETDDGGALYVVSGGDEQPLPGIEQARRVEVTMRSKENGGRLVTWVADASRVTPDEESWGTVTAALVAGRLNLDDLATAADGWAATSVVTRLAPTGETVERPGELTDASHRAVPRETEATTRGPLPRVLHRRVKRRPRLS
ncbi:hypothetical protein [Nocardioides iriomotensis]|uniref:Uncharacterized protein n=1 Tax=Nocardioides iriomotensis TaxID=715784 RepID=A0A4Q5J6L8_9ACTN|nr:hypothetical protein [Nocardioides iriomotensis]RYU14123.1 hypothetical protein ETU37_04240 [Nocardioides iriomotensis]